ncbi:O-antigen ligase family protein [Bacillus sp. B1-b2]|uniref:O-antigen ligase family protein n=1 Tax=Bacillus sp. B1-b2 TaxID=2653201 RepID=UPI001261E597|nr:O-antigen ligase family protein [Bacillus sp. B1-b2]KAB7671696.1 hypothetical protein F9279_05085 [Bacillus sp. B1-b2]
MGREAYLFSGKKLLFYLIILVTMIFINSSFFWIYSSVSIYAMTFFIIILALLKNKFKYINYWTHAYIFVFYCMLTLTFSDGSFGSVLNIICNVFILLILCEYKLDNSNLKLVFLSFLIVNIYWIFNSAGYYQEFYNDRTLINSNIVGMVISYTAIYLRIFLKQRNMKLTSLFSYIIPILSLWAILQLEARGNFFALLIYLLIDSLIPKRLFKKGNILLFLITVIILVGTVIPYIYVNYINLINFDPSITSKDIYTRQYVWNLFFTAMNNDFQSWLFGVGSQADVWNTTSINLHNTYLAIIGNFGLIGYLLYFSLFLRIIAKITKGPNMSTFQIQLILGVTFQLLLGYVEVAMLWDVMYFFNFLFIGLAINEKQKVE